MLVLKQMIPQKKALIFSFKFDTLKKTVHTVQNGTVILDKLPRTFDT